MKIDLEEHEIQNTLQILMNTTGFAWVVTHPLILKISAQTKPLAQAKPEPEEPKKEPAKTVPGRF
jgi:hypothetical protein